MKKIKHIGILILALISFNAKATHIVGGEVYYDYLGNNKYRLVMKVYRDCINGIPNFDGLPNSDGSVTPCYISIFNSDGDLISQITSTPIYDSLVPSNINNPCIIPPNNVCYQEAKYVEEVILPPIFGGYTISYQRCCRNSTILNLINPGGVGATYFEHIPGPEEVVVNSSPRFNTFPPMYICNGISIDFDHAATDPDGDQLVYSICNAYNGLDNCCPFLGYSGSCGSPCPTFNSPSTYESVPYEFPYSAGYPMSSSPAININPQTGFLSGVPNINGQWVVAVCVQEIRNGVVIGTHQRDFQFNVVPCNVLTTAGVANQTTYCTGFNVDFSNLSSSNLSTPTTYDWNFGDTTTLADTSHLFQPTWVYADTGRYTVSLIVNGYSPCSDTTELDFYIYPLLDAQLALTTTSDCMNSNSFDFNAGGVYAPYATFDWNFGPNATPPTSNAQIQNDVSFNGQGPFPVTLIIGQSICRDTATVLVQVVPAPTAGVFPQTNYCIGSTFTFDNTTLNPANIPLTHNWDFGVPNISTDVSNLFEPTYVYQDTGQYTVTLIVNQGTPCADTANIDVYVYPILDADFTYTSNQNCIDNNSFNFASSGVFASYTTFNWNFGSSGNPTTSTNINVNNVQFAGPGPFPVTLVMHQMVCVDSVKKFITVEPYPVAAIQPQTQVCSGFTINFNNNSVYPGTASIPYHWDFGDLSLTNDTSNLFAPSYTFQDTGKFTITVIANYGDLCSDTATIDYFIYPQLDIDIDYNYTKACIDNNSFNFNAIGIYEPYTQFNWDFGLFGLPQQSTLQAQTNVQFYGEGPFVVTLNAQHAVCRDSAQRTILVYPYPVAYFPLIDDEGCQPQWVQFRDSSITGTPLVYFWSFGDGGSSTLQNPFHVYENVGTYNVTLTVQTTYGCIDTSTFVLQNAITVYPRPTAEFAVNPIETIITESTISIHDFSNGGDSILFYTGDGTAYDYMPQSHQYLEAGEYDLLQIVISEHGCPDTATAYVIVLGEYTFYIPNAFTPNTDGKNNIFKPEAYGIYDYEILIFDRWGEQIFQSTDLEIGWNGKYQDKICQEDVYVYKVKFRDVVTNKDHLKAGRVSLIR